MIEKDVVLQQTITYTLYGPIEEFSVYKELLKDLAQVKDDDHITIKLNSPGGRVDVGMMIVDAIRNCKAIVDIVVTHPSYSMGALIALAGDSLVMNPYTFLMFHDYSSITYGKGHDQLSKCEAFSKVFHARFREICKPFLSENECRKILKGQDFYIHWDDESTEKRLKSHFK